MTAEYAQAGQDWPYELDNEAVATSPSHFSRTAESHGNATVLPLNAKERLRAYPYFSPVIDTMNEDIAEALRQPEVMERVYSALATNEGFKTYVVGPNQSLEDVLGNGPQSLYREAWSYSNFCNKFNAMVGDEAFRTAILTPDLLADLSTLPRSAGHYYVALKDSYESFTLRQRKAEDERRQLQAGHAELLRLIDGKTFPVHVSVYKSGNVADGPVTKPIETDGETYTASSEERASAAMATQLNEREMAELPVKAPQVTARKIAAKAVEVAMGALEAAADLGARVTPLDIDPPRLSSVEDEKENGPRSATIDDYWKLVPSPYKLALGFSPSEAKKKEAINQHVLPQIVRAIKLHGEGEALVKGNPFHDAAADIIARRMKKNDVVTGEKE